MMEDFFIIWDLKNPPKPARLKLSSANNNSGSRPPGTVMRIGPSLPPLPPFSHDYEDPYLYEVIHRLSHGEIDPETGRTFCYSFRELCSAKEPETQRR